MKKLLLFLTTLASAAMMAQPTTNLIRKYSFTNGSLLDEAGTATLVHLPSPTTVTPVNDRNNVPNSALEFSNHILYSTSSVDLNSHNAMSWSIWVKPSILTGNHNIMGEWSNDANTQRYLLTKNSNSLAVHVRTTYTAGFVSAPCFSLNAWTHIVVTYDKANLNELKIYANNNLISQTTSTVSYTNSSPGFPNPYFVIGNYGGTNASTVIPIYTGNAFYGNIDDIRIYSKALSASEVTQLYNEGSTSGLNKNEAIQLVTIFPNPAKESFYVKGSSNERLHVSIADLSGKVLKTEVLENKGLVSTQGLNPGMYLISVQTPSGSKQTQKLIIE